MFLTACQLLWGRKICFLDFSLRHSTENVLVRILSPLRLQIWVRLTDPGQFLEKLGNDPLAPT